MLDFEPDLIERVNISGATPSPSGANCPSEWKAVLEYLDRKTKEGFGPICDWAFKKLQRASDPKNQTS
jgi:hypothetical protein